MTTWPVLQLRHVLTVTSGATPESGEATYWDGDVPWVTPEDLSSINQGYRLRETRRSITEEGYKSCGTTLAPINSIVLTKRAPIGQLAVLDVPTCSNQGCLLLTGKRDVDTRFYYYLLNAQTSWLQALGRGSTFMELSVDDLKSLRVPLPKLNEQVAIANFLDIEIDKLDSMLAAKERLLSLISEKRRAVITSIIIRGSNPDAEMKDSGVKWLGQIPINWTTKRVKYLFRLVTEPAPPDNDFELLSLYTEVGVLPRKDIEARGNKATTTDNYWLVKPGDLVVNKLLAWMGAFGVSEYEGVTSPAYDILRPLDGVNPLYYHHLFRCGICYPEFRRRSTGIMDMRLRLYFDEFGDMRVPVPPLEEQQAIIEHIQHETAKLDNLRIAAERTVGLLKERRAALISAAVTGKIEVTV